MSGFLSRKHILIILAFLPLIPIFYGIFFTRFTREGVLELVIYGTILSALAVYNYFRPPTTR
jgi:Na+(H+)/acetate symporter ActP